MSKHQLIVLVVVGAALAACGKKKAAPGAEKTVEGAGAAVASGSAAPLAPAAAANKIGPIDLAAASLDLAALFPGEDLQVIPAEIHGGGGAADTVAYDTIEIERNHKVAMVIELEPKSDRVKSIIVLDATIPTPGGLDVDKPIAAVAAKHADATCVTEKMGTTCSGPSTGLLSYELWPSEGTGAAFGEEVAIAKIAPAATIGQVHWNPPAGKGPTLTKRPPTIDPANEGDEEFEDEGSEDPRKPTAEEVDHCARVYAVVKACGVGHDYEFGWVKSDKKKLSPADAKKACNVAAHVDEDGMSAFPVPVLEADKVAKLEAAAKKSCKAVTDTLDEVSPGIGPAGYDPSK